MDKLQVYNKDKVQSTRVTKHFTKFYEKEL